MNEVMVLGSSGNTSYAPGDEHRPLLSKESGVGKMQVKEEEKSSCFKHTCQDYACMSAFLLVGVALLATGIALCVMGTSLVIGGLLIAVGVLSLLAGLSEIVLLCQDRRPEVPVQTLEEEIEDEELIWEERLYLGDGPEEMFDSYKHLSALYTIRENIS